MRHPHPSNPTPSAGLPLSGLAAFLVLCLAGSSAFAQTPSLEPRVPAGQCLSDPGTVLARSAPGRAWQALGTKDSAPSRDLLLALPGVRGELSVKDGGVRLTLWGNLSSSADLPVLGAGVVLHDTRAYDADFTIERGRVVVTNRKEKGEAKLWVRLPVTAWELTLAAPGDQAALELSGRRPRGPFEKDPQRSPPPIQLVTLHVLKGNATLRAGDQVYSLGAPPGPAYFHWDSLTGPDNGPQRREQVPAWVSEGKLPANVAAARDALLAAVAKADSVPAALRSFPRSAARESDQEKAEARRRLAVYALGSVDDLEGLVQALSSEENSVTRQAAVDALRHWIGRTRGQDQRLYRFLIQRQEYPEAQAETVLQLLHSPFVADRPETYDTLIAYLRHSRLPVRELARWHLYRLARAGRKIPYDAASPTEERQKAYQAWKKLIPDGKLPPERLPDEKK
jgi:hypothetical protein